MMDGKFRVGSIIKTSKGNLGRVYSITERVMNCPKDMIGFELLNSWVSPSGYRYDPGFRMINSPRSLTDDRDWETPDPGFLWRF